jgi:hypothetical protein
MEEYSCVKLEYYHPGIQQQAVEVGYKSFKTWQMAKEGIDA